jgi:proline dehydrogenase
MIDRVSTGTFYLSRGVFSLLARSQTLERLASRYGMRQPHSFARRFVAGETVEEAIDAARAIETAGMTATLDYLGESVATMAEAGQATREYLDVIERIAAAGIDRNVSLKLTQLGLMVDRATAVDNLRRILDAAGAHHFFVRIDMEDSSVTQVTLDIFETIWQQGYRNAGAVLQSYLPRSAADATRLSRLGARIRLVKGAYNEPKSVAYQRKTDVDRAFLSIMRILLTSNPRPAIATHDPAMIAATREFASSQGIGPDRFEFQLLYGIRRDLQARLTREGYQVRVYIPFGRQWFSYFMRRLGERPANFGFVLKSLLRER